MEAREVGMGLRTIPSTLPRPASGTVVSIFTSVWGKVDYRTENRGNGSANY